MMPLGEPVFDEAGEPFLGPGATGAKFSAFLLDF